MSPEHRQANLYERALKAFGRTTVGKWYARTIPPLVDPQMLRLTGEWISSLHPLPAMLLTTIGARTRQSRTQPLVYLTDDAGLILVAGARHVRRVGLLPGPSGRTDHPADQVGPHPRLKPPSKGVRLGG
jgi:F420H(2)-dependent quinone reductase